MLPWRSGMRRKRNPLRLAASIFAAVVGCFLIAAGLELFLRPNNVAPGGIAGVSVLASHVTEMKISLWLFCLNLPFVLYRWKYVARGPLAIALPLVGVVAFAYVLHPVSALVEEPLPGALGGGVCLGLGIGMILRQGGRFDEAETAVKRLPSLRNADMVVFVSNLSILAAAGLIFGAEQAIYSVLAHALAYLMVEVGFSGMSPYRRILVRSRNLPSMQRATKSAFYVQWIPTDEEYSAMCVVHRSDAARVRRLLRELDNEVQMIGNLEHARETIV
ncbi:YitT family protein [Paenibacillus sp.]|uniref:YitT family protein n=1 Tax=Paenibacillus sp. TaxID=58172 RepID=UPI0028127876|nr:YitT family protein [Paenibacillus sp.]